MSFADEGDEVNYDGKARDFIDGLGLDSENDGEEIIETGGAPPEFTPMPEQDVIEDVVDDEQEPELEQQESEPEQVKVTMESPATDESTEKPEQVKAKARSKMAIGRVNYAKARLRLDPMIALPPKHPAYFIIGRKGWGKSALVERMGEIYWWLDYVILDWNGAFDLESLHWCIKGDRWRDKKKKWHDGLAYPILLITPANLAVFPDHRKIQRPDTGEWVDAVKTVPDTEPLENIIMQAYRERRVVVFSIYFYKQPEKGQWKLSEFIKALPEVMRDKVPDYVHCAMLLRELADIASNRMKTHAGSGEKETKRGLSFFFRQARHARTTIIADMQNPDDIYGAIEAQEDFILIKRLNKHHIPKKLQWVVDEIAGKLHWAASHYILDQMPYVNIDHLNRGSFYCVWPEGHFSLKHNSLPRFRHHKTNDNAMKMAGLKKQPIAASESAKTAEAQIADMQQKKATKEKYVDLLNKATTLYIQRKKKNPAYSWDDCAGEPEINFRGADDKPSGEGLRAQIHRYGKRNLIGDYKELVEILAKYSNKKRPAAQTPPASQAGAEQPKNHDAQPQDPPA